MIGKKFLLQIVFLFFISFIVFSEDARMAEFYINKAFEYYKSGQFAASEDILEKSFAYSKSYPEYYYIYNLLLEEKRDNNHIKKDNADKIAEYLNNSFLVEEYDFIKQISKIYEEVKESEKSYNFYKKLVSLRNKMNIDDYMSFIDMLFKAKGKSQFELIPQVISEAKFYYESLDFDYYLILFKLLKGGVVQKDFDFVLNKLSSNKYPPERQLYLKSLFYNDRSSVSNLYAEYLSLHENKSINDFYQKKILYNIILKSRFLNDRETIFLLNEWRDIGQNDIKSLDFLLNKRLYNFVNNEEELKKTYINYSGIREKDNDEDGAWEERYEYKNGVLISRILDLNQDGVYEKKIVNYDEGNIKDLYVYKSMNNFFKYSFNKNDKSLEYLETYSNGAKNSKLTFVSSSFYPKIEGLENVSINELLLYVDYSEIWDNDIYKKVKYSRSVIEYIDIDTNNNKLIDKRELYKNGKLDVVLKDNNENGKFEVYEKYSEGTLNFITYMSDEGVIDISYKEVFLKSGVQKYWDYDNNGKYEVSVIEYNNGMIRKFFDINFDGNFDFEIDSKNNAFKITDSKKPIMQNINFMEKNKSNNKNWTIISVKDIKELSVPDNIIVSDKRSLSGYYYYKGGQHFFKRGIIKSSDFSYRLSLLDEKIFLFEE